MGVKEYLLTEARFLKILIKENAYRVKTANLNAPFPAAFAYASACRLSPRGGKLLNLRRLQF